MKKIYSSLSNPDVQGAILIISIVGAITLAFFLTLGK